MTFTEDEYSEDVINKDSRVKLGIVHIEKKMR